MHKWVHGINSSYFQILLFLVLGSHPLAIKLPKGRFYILRIADRLLSTSIGILAPLVRGRLTPFVSVFIFPALRLKFTSYKRPSGFSLALRSARLRCSPLCHLLYFLASFVPARTTLHQTLYNLQLLRHALRIHEHCHLETLIYNVYSSLFDNHSTVTYLYRFLECLV